LAQVAFAAAVAIGASALATAPTAGADSVAYLLNVTVRPCRTPPGPVADDVP